MKRYYAILVVIGIILFANKNICYAKVQINDVTSMYDDFTDSGIIPNDEQYDSLPVSSGGMEYSNEDGTYKYLQTEYYKIPKIDKVFFVTDNETFNKVKEKPTQLADTDRYEMRLIAYQDNQLVDVQGYRGCVIYVRTGDYYTTSGCSENKDNIWATPSEWKAGYTTSYYKIYSVNNYKAPIFPLSEINTAIEYSKGNISITDVDKNNYILPDDVTINKNGELVEQRKVYDESLGYPIRCKLVNAKAETGNMSDVKFTWDNKEKKENVELEVYISVKGKYKYYPWDSWKDYHGNWVKKMLDVNSLEQIYGSSQFTASYNEWGNIFLKYQDYHETNLHLKCRYVKEEESKLLYGDWVHCTLNNFLNFKSTSKSWVEEGTKTVEDSDKDFNGTGEDAPTKEVEEYNKEEELNKDYGIFSPLVNWFNGILTKISGAFNEITSNVKSVMVDNSFVKYCVTITNGILPEWLITLIWTAFGLTILIGVVKTLLRR